MHEKVNNQRIESRNKSGAFATMKNVFLDK